MSSTALGRSSWKREGDCGQASFPGDFQFGRRSKQVRQPALQVVKPVAGTNGLSCEAGPVVGYLEEDVPVFRERSNTNFGALNPCTYGVLHAVFDQRLQ